MDEVMKDLQEDKWYDFKVMGVISLPGGKDYFKLEDPNGILHLLPSGSFPDLTSGSVIRCLVVKINCSGRIFLEPEHPVYIPGDKFPFAVEKVECSNGKGEVIVSGYQDVPVPLPCEGFAAVPVVGEEIELEIERIKNGIPVLVPPLFQETVNTLETGEKYVFRVLYIASYNRGYDYYILERNGRKTAIRMKYYSGYGFGPGDEIRCLVKESKIKKRYLEPEHPVYRPGDTVNFKVLRIEEIQEYTGAKKKVLILEHAYGKELYADLRFTGSQELPSALNCRILDIAHGRPVLECNQ